MSRKYGTLMASMLTAVGEATGFFEWPIPGTQAWTWKQRHSKKSVRDAVYSLKRQGLIIEVKEKGKKFLKLTSKGELQRLMFLAVLDKPDIWDKQWRIIIFDIPEETRDKRNELRQLLKRNGFRKLQASVFISPYPLNREAIIYLKKTGLNQYIRIIRANEIDDDSDLKRLFKLV